MFTHALDLLAALGVADLHVGLVVAVVVAVRLRFHVDVTRTADAGFTVTFRVTF